MILYALFVCYGLRAFASHSQKPDAHADPTYVLSHISIATQRRACACVVTQHFCLPRAALCVWRHMYVLATPPHACSKPRIRGLFCVYASKSNLSPPKLPTPITHTALACCIVHRASMTFLYTTPHQPEHRVGARNHYVIWSSVLQHHSNQQTKVCQHLARRSISLHAAPLPIPRNHRSRHCSRTLCLVSRNWYSCFR